MNLGMNDETSKMPITCLRQGGVYETTSLESRIKQQHICYDVIVMLCYVKSG